MAKTLTIRIKPLGEAMETFRQTFKAVEVSTRSTTRVQHREGIFFTSIEAARKLLTPNRLALLRAIRTGRPGSMYALARRMGRDLKMDLPRTGGHLRSGREPTRRESARSGQVQAHTTPPRAAYCGSPVIVPSPDTREPTDSFMRRLAADP